MVGSLHHERLMPCADADLGLVKLLSISINQSKQVLASLQ